ncbi:MAG: hypothetical protein COA42_12630 [Alteromonadaceae bacterium]|nr:MAG: hypothetical protein COA42_12630 [Alteromonadaceae bacterium]
MKKILGALALGLASQGALAIDATPLFDVSLGGGVWNAKFEGELGDESTDVDLLNLDEETNGFFYISFEHAIPVIPQIRIEHTQISTQGLGQLDFANRLGLGDFDFVTNVHSEIDFTFTDVTLYYELAWIDFGLTARQFSAEVFATGEDLFGNFQSEEEKEDGVLPMLYIATRIDIPGTGFYVRGNANYIAIDDKSVSDFSAGVGYGVKLSFLAEIGIEAGIRSFALDLGDENDFQGDIEITGAYLGLNVNF